MTRYLGIDPGLTGAVAVLDDGDLLRVFDMESADGRLLVGLLLDRIRPWNPEVAVIERVGPMPKQGVSSTWKFARAYGCVEGMVETLGLPVHEITPAVWKRTIGVTSDKLSARAEACRRWPLCREWFGRVRDSGRAEAALLVIAWLHRNVQH